MLVRDAIDTEVATVESTASLREVRRKVDETDGEIWPVVDPSSGKLVGELTRSDLEEHGASGGLVSGLDLEEAVKIYEGQHIFEAARLMLQYERRSLPVIDQEWKLRGVITKQRVLEALGRMLNLARKGSVIMIELDMIDFTLSEIVHLIETEEAKILGITVETPGGEETSLEVSIKLNVEDATRVSSSLRRHGYTVSTESVNESFGMDLENRADELLKYLDM